MACSTKATGKKVSFGAVSVVFFTPQVAKHYESKQGNKRKRDNEGDQKSEDTPVKKRQASSLRHVETTTDKRVRMRTRSEKITASICPHCKMSKTTFIGARPGSVRAARDLWPGHLKTCDAKKQCLLGADC
jgi:hypothetical protein